MKALRIVLAIAAISVPALAQTAPFSGGGTVVVPDTPNILKGSGDATNGMKPAIPGTDYPTPAQVTAAQSAAATDATNKSNAAQAAAIAAATAGASVQCNQSQFANSDLGTQLGLCINAAVALGGGHVDAGGLTGSRTISTSVTIPSGVDLIMPQAAHWTCNLSSTSTYCLLYKAGSSNHGNAVGGGGNPMVLDTASGASMKAVVGIDPSATFNYNYITGFSVQNNGQLASSSLSTEIDVNNTGDQSKYVNVAATNYYGDAWHITNAGCGTVFDGIQGYASQGQPGGGASGYANGGTPLVYAVTSTSKCNGAVKIQNSTFNAPKTGLSNVTFAGVINLLIFDNNYMEGNCQADTSTPMMTIGGAVTGLVVTGGNFQQACSSSSATKYAVQNSSPNPFSITAYQGNGVFVNDTANSKTFAGVQFQTNTYPVAAAGSVSPATINPQTSTTYTQTAADCAPIGNVIPMNSGSASTVQLLAPSSTVCPSGSFTQVANNTGLALSVLAANSTATIGGLTNYAVPAGVGSSLRLLSNGTSWQPFGGYNPAQSGGFVAAVGTAGASSRTPCPPSGFAMFPDASGLPSVCVNGGSYTGYWDLLGAATTAQAAAQAASLAIANNGSEIAAAGTTAQTAFRTNIACGVFCAYTTSTVLSNPLNINRNRYSNAAATGAITIAQNTGAYSAFDFQLTGNVTGITVNGEGSNSDQMWRFCQPTTGTTVYTVVLPTIFINAAAVTSTVGQCTEYRTYGWSSGSKLEASNSRVYAREY